MDKREHLQEYLRTTLGELSTKKVIPKGASLDSVIWILCKQFAIDVAADGKFVLGVIGRGMAVSGVRMAQMATRTAPQVQKARAEKLVDAAGDFISDWLSDWGKK